MKRIVKGIVAAFLAMSMTFGLTGCLVEKPSPEYENEYFRYAVGTKQDGSKFGRLVGFTELGAEQTELILPEEIDGIPIVNFGYRLGGPFGDDYGHVGEFISENLKKLYVPFNGENWGMYWGNYSSLPNTYIVIWKSKKITSFNCTPKVKGDIVGFNILAEYLSGFSYGSAIADEKIANISYMSNYDGAANDGTYWVDSYDSDLVSFIPPEPTREGYRFGGWYKEAECVNTWDFAKDKTEKEIILKKGSSLKDYDNSGITYLYAKWDKEE